MEKVILYRLFAVQDFGKRVDKKLGRIAVYIKDGDYPDVEIMFDALTIVNKEMSRTELIHNKPLMYLSGDPSAGWSALTDPNRVKLRYLERIFERARKMISAYPDTKYAMFVDSTNHRDWHGEKALYYSRHFDEVKSTTPDGFSGCKKVGMINL